MYDNDVKDSPAKLFFRKKWVRMVLGIDLIAIVAIIAFAIYNNTKTAIIIFDVAPIDATISINGNTNYNNATYRIHPGNYTITISHEGLDSKTFNVDLPAHSSTLLSTYLSAAGGTDYSFYEQRDNFESTQKLLAIAMPSQNQTYDHDTSADSFVTKYEPTLDAYNMNLPISDFTRNSPDNGGNITSIISIQKDDTCAKYLCVLGYTVGIPDGENRIKSLLTEAGFDLNYLEIKYETN